MRTYMQTSDHSVAYLSRRLSVCLFVQLPIHPSFHAYMHFMLVSPRGLGTFTQLIHRNL